MPALTQAPGGTVTVLLGDVERSVRRWEADREGTSRLMADLSLQVDEATAAYDGFRPLEQGEGDSFVVVFPRASDAVACALDIQVRLLNATPTEPLRVRMAIHSDEARLRDERNYEGALMHRAARLRALAYGGQVLLSGTTHSLTSDRLPPDAKAVDLGIHRLRDIAEPERVWQLLHPDLPDDFPSLVSDAQQSTNLPSQLTTFVGRDTEVRIVDKLLYEHRLVSLTGPGGVGKTRLAIEIAREVSDRYTRGVRFVDLSAISHPDGVAGAVAAGVRARDDISRSPLESIVTSLGNDVTLVILDNCEHVIGAAATVADALVRGCPSVDVLVTTREPLNVGGEVVVPVARLEAPTDLRGVDAVTALEFDAIRLFVDRAAMAQAEFELNDTAAAAVASICSQLDGLPLAIELAAARMRVMSLEMLDASLADRFSLLDAGPRTASRRQQSLHASIAWSYDLLDGAERALLRRLGMFSATFALDVVEVVCTGAPVTTDEVRGAFLSLVDKSLVARAQGGRYRLLETVRQFARDRLEESDDDADDLRRRHLRFLAQLAFDAEEGRYGPPTQWMARLDAEIPDIDRLIAWAPEDEHAHALRLAASLAHLCFLTFRSGSGLRRLDSVLPPEPKGVDEALWADALFSSGLLLVICGDSSRAAQAPARLAGARAVYERLGMRRDAARLRGLFAVLGLQLVGAKQTKPEWNAAIDELHALGDRRWEGMLNATWGSVSVYIGRPAEGEPFLERGHAIGVEEDDEFLQRYTSVWTAAGLGMRGRHREAIEVAQRCLRAVVDAHDSDSQSFLSGIISNGYWELGDIEAAEKYAIEAAGIGDRYNHPAHAAIGHAGLGRIALTRGDPQRAAECFNRAIATVEQRHPELVARHASWLAEAYIDLRRYDDARGAIARGTAVVAPRGHSADLVRLHLATARLERAMGNDAGAEDAAQAALALVGKVGGAQNAITALELLGSTAAAQDSDAEAVRLFGAAQRLRTQLGRGAGAANVELALVRERLGPEAYSAAWDEGEAMSLDEAIAYAARGRGERKRPSHGWASLTPTELEVVRYVTMGLTNPEIGERMFISRGTVRTHLTHVFAKLGVKTRTQLAMEASTRGSRSIEVGATPP